MSTNTGKSPDASAARASIEDNLRKVYQEALDAEIPDRFKSLLEQLRSAQTGAKKDDSR
ncbi:MAG: NepR family anti-sigma factor [Paracoccaceae bacterium]